MIQKPGAPEPSGPPETIKFDTNADGTRSEQRFKSPPVYVKAKIAVAIADPSEISQRFKSPNARFIQPPQSAKHMSEQRALITSGLAAVSVPNV